GAGHPFKFAYLEPCNLAVKHITQLRTSQPDPKAASLFHVDQAYVRQQLGNCDRREHLAGRNRAINAAGEPVVKQLTLRRHHQLRPKGLKIADQNLFRPQSRGMSGKTR
ncbi:MAG: hypothetical protein AAFW74_16220, partial [Pseudomonadota bacterium]